MQRWLIDTKNYTINNYLRVSLLCNFINEYNENKAKNIVRKQDKKYETVLGLE